MSSISRRDLLKGAALAGGALAVVGSGSAEAREKVEPGTEAVGMLFDSTRCVGCRACQTACKKANKLPADEVHAGGVYDAPTDLNSTTKNVIKVLPTAQGDVYMKQQCMHCVDPSCVSACMMAALHKEGESKKSVAGEKKGSGIVLWDKSTCVGCRYCQIACAFNVPKFEWNEAFPAIVKCELCRSRADAKATGPLAVANPACCEVCPREAVVYGHRSALLAEAKRRVAAAPNRYADKVYGEKDGGGTQVLYLAAKGVSFQDLGLPALSERSPAQFSESVSHAPYLHGVTPIALYAAMAFVINRNKKKEEAGHAGEEK
jgi:Fe-S-cluster-containing dehydrogenase component